MNDKIKKFIKLLSLFVIIILSYFYVKSHSEEFIKIFTLTASQFIILSFFTFIGLILNGYLFNNLVKLFNVDLKLKEWLSLTILNNYTNYFFTKGGQIVRSIYLKKNHQLLYKDYLLLFILMNLLIAFTISLLFIITAFYAFKEINFYFLLFFIILNLISIFLFFIPKKILFLFNKNNKIQSIAKTWIKIRNNKKIITIPISLIGISLLSLSLKIFLIYQMIFIPIDFSSAIIIASIGMISPFLAITPAALGIREGLMSFTASLIGENFSTAAAVAILDRAISMFWIFTLGFITSISFLTKYYKTKTKL